MQAKARLACGLKGEAEIDKPMTRSSPGVSQRPSSLRKNSVPFWKSKMSPRCKFGVLCFAYPDHIEVQFALFDNVRRVEGLEVGLGFRCCTDDE